MQVILKLHIPAEIEDSKTEISRCSIYIWKTIGVHEEVLTILTDRLEEVGFETSMRKHPDTAVILLGRGGSDADANSDFYKITRLLWEKLNVKWVESAFMGVTDPLVDEGVERCVKLGAKKIVMLPYFLFTGILMERLENMMRQIIKKNTLSMNLSCRVFWLSSKLQTIFKEACKRS